MKAIVEITITCEIEVDEDVDEYELSGEALDDVEELILNDAILGNYEMPDYDIDVAAYIEEDDEDD